MKNNTAICETFACSCINSIIKVMHTDSQLLPTSLASAEHFPVYEVMQFFH